MRVIRLTSEQLDWLKQGRIVELSVCPSVGIALVDKHGQTADEALSAIVPDSN